MLAERKKRVKWTLNPCGNFWSQDESKFGQRMLEKMGWKPGSGLGVNEQGITEHIKVRYKSDTKCIGYKEAGDKWLEQQSEFESFLAQLSSSHSAATPDSADKSTASLEARSQQSRARVHYKKFTRGKDLSNYTDKDLACILGVKQKSCDSDDQEDGKKAGLDEAEAGDEKEGRTRQCSLDENGSEKKKQKKLRRLEESDVTETKKKRRKEKCSIDGNTEEEATSEVLRADADTSQQLEERESQKKKKKKTNESITIVECTEYGNETTKKKKKKKKDKLLEYDEFSKDSGDNVYVENVNEMEVVESGKRDAAKQMKRSKEEAKPTELAQCGDNEELQEKRRKRKKLSFSTEGEVLQKKQKTEEHEVLQIHNDNVENCKQSSDSEENTRDKCGVKEKGEDMQPIGEQPDTYSIKNMRPGMFAKLVDPTLIRFRGSNVHKLQGYGRI